MKKNKQYYYIFILFISFLLFNNNFVSASVSSPPSYVNYSDCIKIFPTNSEKLFYLTLSSISDLNYKVIEMQSEGGYIIFDAFKREFLVLISQKNENFSQIKITPVNNSYIFNYDLINRIFQKIYANFDLNQR